MPVNPDDLDITTDLNAQSPDAVPYHGDDSLQIAQPPKQAPEVPEEGGKPATLRDQLSDAFKQHDGTQAPQQPDADQQPPAQPQGKPPVELQKVGERFHRLDGSFASKEEIDAFNAFQAGQAPEAPLPQWTKNLTPVEQDQFKSLPKETRQFVERTMDGLNNQAAVFQDYNLIEQVIGTRRQAWAQQGMPPAVALQNLLNISDFAGRDPGKFVLWFADQQRLNLDQLLDARDAQANQPVDPRYQGLQQEIVQLRSAIEGMTSQNTSQLHAENLALVQSFMNERDDKGNLLHPHFEEVGAEIQQHAALLRQQQPYLDSKEILKAAYDFATYSNQSVRAKIQEASAQALRDQAAAEAARARQAGVSINGGPAGDAGTQPNNANRTLREELVHAYQQSTLQ